MDRQFTRTALCILGDNSRSKFQLMWVTLLKRVHRKFFWLDRSRIEDALADAILRRLTRDCGDVENALDEMDGESIRSLYTEVYRNVTNAIRSERRRYRREREYVLQKKNWLQENSFVQNGPSVEHIRVNQVKEALDKLLVNCTECEREFVRLRKQGVKDLSVYAKVLGISDHPPENQRSAINRVWNRIRMKLRRMRADQVQSEE